MRNAHSYLSNIDDVKTWFEQVGKPIWKLFRGFHDRTKGKALIYAQDQDGMDMEESFSLLAQMIDMHCSPAGRFTILVPTSTSGQGVTQWVQIGDMSAGTSAITNHPGVAGAPMSGYIPESKLREEIEKERRMWMLERQVEDMEAAREANMNVQEILAEKLREIPMDVAINGIIQAIQGRRVSLQGLAGEQTAPPPPTPEGEGTGYEYPAEELLPILDDIRQHFQDNGEFLKFLGTLRDRFLEAPETYKNMLQ